MAERSGDLVLSKLIELSTEMGELSARFGGLEEQLRDIPKRLSKVEDDSKFVKAWSAGALFVLLGICGLAWKLYDIIRSYHGT